MNSRSRLIVAVLVVLALASNFGVAYYFKGSIDSFAEAAAAVSPNNQKKILFQGSRRRISSTLSRSIGDSVRFRKSPATASLRRATLTNISARR